ncbi:glycosyltransferase [Nocardia goodfellowii]|uniref:Galactosyl transferase GMA12/MNN10 family protein n=1 Tax=Nocardia goodfellowii TaxID=882446 RepID=A0ABS4QRI3_9NOCA|nr:glycosyltransferase [Nocardia goodfellowii]MBP2194328.1 hypothetical protein [Nocardia goodfellowii]
MHRTGARISLAPLGTGQRGTSRELRGLLAESSARVDGPVLYSGWLSRPEVDCLRRTDLFIRTACESSRICARWVERLNQARAVIVPSQYAADVFRTCGVTTPLYIVPDAVDPDAFPYRDRSGRAGLTTLIVGILEPDNNYRQAIAGWQEAFRDDPEARLIIKSWQGWPDCHIAGDPRVHLDTLNEPAAATADWYAEADVLLALGNESFGTGMLEAMATGLPVVALDSEGQSGVCRDAGELVLPIAPATWRPYEHPYGGASHGVVAVPETADVATRLRWVAAHRAEAADIGRAASRWVRAQRNIWNSGPDVLAVIAEHTRSPRYAKSLARNRPLRPAPAPATPSAPSPAPVAQPDGPPLWSYRPPHATPLGIVTLWSPDIESWALPHAQDKYAYCERHGLAFYGYTDVFTGDRAPHWSKIPAVQRHLDDHDWLYWIDADAAVTNFDFDLRALCDDDYDFIATHDELGLNSGSFLIRNNEATRAFLRLAWAQNVTDLFYEQTAMARAIALQPELRVKILEKRTMNSFWDEHRPGDFVIHAAGQPTDVKIALLEAFRTHNSRLSR